MDDFLIEDLVEIGGMIGFFVVMGVLENNTLKLMNPITLRELNYPIALVESHYRPVK